MIRSHRSDASFPAWAPKDEVPRGEWGAHRPPAKIPTGHQPKQQKTRGKKSLLHWKSKIDTQNEAIFVTEIHFPNRHFGQQFPRYLKLTVGQQQRTGVLVTAKLVSIEKKTWMIFDYIGWQMTRSWIHGLQESLHNWVVWSPNTFNLNNQD